MSKSLFQTEVIRVSGQDSERYLQGRLSQDIKKTSLETPLPSFLLSPQGRLKGLCSIARDKDGAFLIYILGGQADEFLDELMRFKVADQVEAAVEEVELILESPFEQKTKKSCLAWPSLIDSDTEESSLIGFSLSKSTEKNLDLVELKTFRLQLGLPMFSEDIGSGQLASLLKLKDWVSFTKGCYAGQEVIEKLDAYGRGKKSLILLESASALESPLELTAIEKAVELSSIGSAISGSFRAFAQVSDKELEVLTKTDYQVL